MRRRDRWRGSASPVRPACARLARRRPPQTVRAADWPKRPRPRGRPLPRWEGCATARPPRSPGPGPAEALLGVRNRRHRSGLLADQPGRRAEPRQREPGWRSVASPRRRRWRGAGRRQPDPGRRSRGRPCGDAGRGRAVHARHAPRSRGAGGAVRAPRGGGICRGGAAAIPRRRRSAATGCSAHRRI